MEPTAGEPTERRPGELGVGCPMWAHRGWVGRWFPPDVATGSELACYATWCTAVEGNTTFYALPEPRTVDRWAEQAPPGFRFCFKLPRTITHDRRLRDTDDELRVFLRRIEPLADRLGPTSIQLPASFGPSDLGALDMFLEGVPRELRWGVEVRHRAFEAEGSDERRLHDLLHGHGVERVVIDTRILFAGPRGTPEEIEAFERKPRLRVRPIALGPEPVVRFVGANDATATVDGWQRWAEVVARWVGEGRRPVFFVHTPDNLDAPALARRFHDDVARRVDLVPLPEPRLGARQRSIFDTDVVEPQE